MGNSCHSDRRHLNASNLKYWTRTKYTYHTVHSVHTWLFSVIHNIYNVIPSFTLKNHSWSDEKFIWIRHAPSRISHDAFKSTNNTSATVIDEHIHQLWTRTDQGFPGFSELVLSLILSVVLRKGARYICMQCAFYFMIKFSNFCSESKAWPCMHTLISPSTALIYDMALSLDTETLSG